MAADTAVQDHFIPGVDAFQGQLAVGGLAEFELGDGQVVPLFHQQLGVIGEREPVEIIVVVRQDVVDGPRFRFHHHVGGSERR